MSSGVGVGSAGVGAVEPAGGFKTTTTTEETIEMSEAAKRFAVIRAERRTGARPPDPAGLVKIDPETGEMVAASVAAHFGGGHRRPGPVDPLDAVDVRAQEVADRAASIALAVANLLNRRFGV